MPQLLFRSGPLSGRRVPLTPKGLVVGRDPDPACDLALGSARVSGRHAAIVYEGGRWCLRDLGSLNGTYLNEEPVSRSVVLTSGARVVFGDVECVFEDPLSHEPSPQPVPAPPPPEVPEPLAVRPPAPPDALKTLRQGVSLLRRSGGAGAGLAQRLKQATAELERAVSQRDPELTRQAVTRLLEEGGALSGLAGELTVVFETTERSLDHFDKVLREAEEQSRKGGR